MPDDAQEEPEPQRNFTPTQLLYFNGEPEDTSGNSKHNTTENETTLKPIYLSVNGIVFDCSHGRDFYGPDGPYAAFAGHECGVALAKMSFDTEFLDDLEGCSTKLERHEQEELEGWIDKFTHYRPYPIMGRLVPDSQMPDASRDIPDGYAAKPIYVGAADKIFDMSFGGIGFYGPGCAYGKFAGRDVSRALSLMKLDDCEVQSTDLSDVTAKQLQTLKDWVKTFEQRKQYPIVGRLKKSMPEGYDDL